ncbi:MAG: urease accessory protein UreF [Myxococcaceae bacterium]|nr:urease accessory protein UreF [Myxococcaceae bacterium]
MPSLPDGALDTRDLLLALQLGDSFFPSGASAFSFGLEGLHTAGLIVDADALERFVADQLTLRWATCDRVALLHAHAAGDELDRLCEIDEFVDCSSLVSSWRLGGRRLGKALLATHRKLGTAHAADYEARVERGRARGQVAVVQGLVGFARGLSAHTAAVLSGYGLSVGIVGPALRLGIIGHVDAQRILLRQHERLEQLVQVPLPALDELSAWVPATEVASMRQEARHGRLFAT